MVAAGDLEIYTMDSILQLAPYRPLSTDIYKNKYTLRKVFRSLP